MKEQRPRPLSNDGKERRLKFTHENGEITYSDWIDFDQLYMIEWSNQLNMSYPKTVIEIELREIE